MEDARTSLVERLRSKLTFYPDFPKKGISFVDIFPLFQNPDDVDALLSIFHDRLKGKDIQVVVGLEARGFLFGPLLARLLKCAFVPIRKQGKLPGDCISAVYTKEYGHDTFEMQTGSIQEGQRCVVIDDLLATGGTARCAGQLIKGLGGIIVEYQFVIKLVDLKGQTEIEDLQTTVFSVIDIRD